MAISSRDQRILRQIEEDLITDDPDLARWLGDPTLVPSARTRLSVGRRVGWATAGFVIGTVGLAATLFQGRMLLFPVVALALIVSCAMWLGQLAGDIGPVGRAGRRRAIGALRQLFPPTGDRAS